MNSSRSNYSAISNIEDDDQGDLYTQRSELPSNRFTPRDPPSNRFTPREQKSSKTHQSKHTPKVPPISIPSTVREDSPPSSPKQLVCSKHTKGHVVPSKFPGDEPISPIYFVPKKGATNVKNGHTEITSIYGNSANFKYDKLNKSLHLMISGNTDACIEMNGFSIKLNTKK